MADLRSSEAPLVLLASSGMSYASALMCIIESLCDCDLWCHTSPGAVREYSTFITLIYAGGGVLVWQRQLC